MTTRIDQIISQISSLEDDEKLQVMESILQMIRKNEDKNQKANKKLSDLKGLSADIWKDIDINKYLENERQWD